MSVRTTNPLNSYQSLLDLQRIKDQMSVLGDQISSGNRNVRLGDDPTGSALVLDFQTSISRNNAFIQQANTATSFLQTSETTLQSVSDSITRLVEIGQQGVSDTTSASGRAQIASEVDGIRTNLMALANTQSDGKYIFAGTKTTTIPFSGPAAGPITYAGDGNSIDLQVSQSSTVTTNVPGSTAFFGAGGQGSATDLFQQVTDLRDGLTTNNTALIQTAYTNLQSILGQVSTTITDLGGRQASLTQLQDNMQSYNLSLQSIQNTYSEVDYPTAISKYSEEQTSYQASLSILSKTNNQNLFNYLT